MLDGSSYQSYKADMRWPIHITHYLPLLAILVMLAAPHMALAQSAPGAAVKGTQTGLPLPRFVSLAKSEVNLRAGPSTRYPIRWVYYQKNLPVEIVREYDHWRKIRDSDGDEGWVHKALLTGRRNGIITLQTVDILKKPGTGAALAAQATKGAVLALDNCDLDWCKISHNRISGYVRREAIWGLYSAETIGNDR